jgi:hypothetical protein
MSIEELSKLWTTFQTPLRISAAYQACVVLIESEIPPRTPLPVLTRGPGDVGVIVRPSVDEPRITAVEYERRQPSALIGGRITLAGRSLGGGQVRVEVSSRRLADPVTLTPVSATDTQVEADLPAGPAALPAGDYELTVTIVAPPAPDRMTPAVLMSVAPRITAGLPGPLPSTGGTLTLKFEPDILPGQPVMLIVGAGPGIAGTVRQPDRLEFEVPALPAGSHFVRLRIDGVDSQLVDRTTTPPVFDATQALTVQ